MTKFRGLAALAVLVLSLGVIGAQESPFPAPAPSPAPPPPPPPPAPPSGVTVNLTPDTLYVVSVKADGALRAHPAGMVKVTKEVGPITLRGVFAEAPDKGVQTKKFAGPTVFLVEALPGKSGPVELDYIPYGFKAETEILSTTIQVNAGQAPQPPPGPNPTPSPNGTGAWVIVVADEANPTIAQGKLLDGPTLKMYRDNGRCRIYTSITEADKIKEKGYDVVLRAANLTSGVIVLDTSGKPLLTFAIPADDAALATKLKGVMQK